MASLYIKDADTAALAERVARIRGVTKTKAVRDALEAALQDARPRERKPELIEWIERRRAEHPLRPTGRASDKSFFDALWGDV